MRKERDLNPRYPLGVCVLSRDVLSATQPSFHIRVEEYPIVEDPLNARKNAEN